MNQLSTIFSSNNPVDCYILRGRLESEGIKCFIFDEHTINVHPFHAVSIGGVKLKIPVDSVDYANELIELIDSNLLIDNMGVYELSEVFKNEKNRIDEILRIQTKIRNNPKVLEDNALIEAIAKIVDNAEEFIAHEKKFLDYRDRTFSFNWKQFWYRLLDFDESIFDYFRIRPNSYYLDEEIIQNFSDDDDTIYEICCPICGSSNIKNGIAVDYGWNILQIISVIFGALFLGPGFFISQSKIHCFNCGNNFKK